ncbi:MAG: hypothetical protein HUJ26_10625 [Planctomycetaceae bacterium]|nr:hypothetical protein [Planctomycetaceae bacterium]
MNIPRRKMVSWLSGWGLALISGTAVAQQRGRRGGGPPSNRGQGQGSNRGGQGQGSNRGQGQGRGGPGNQGGRGRDDADHQMIQTLMQNRNQIRRKIENLPNGVRTITETDNDQLRPVLISHVKSMYDRLEEGRPIHRRDPLFRELFAHAKEIKMVAKPTDKGLMVIETSNNPQVVKMIQAHAEVVSLFLKNGPAEARKNHAVPN